MNSSNSQIQIRVGQLLRDSVTYTLPIYVPVLTFLIPSFIISVLVLGMTPGAQVLLFVVNWFGLLPFVTGAAIFYVYQVLRNEEVTIPKSLQVAGERFTQLVLLAFMIAVFLGVGFLFLIIPGIYLSIRFSFAYYALMLEGCSAFDALSRSWKLTQGHWWKLFWLFFVLGIVVFIPIFLLLLIVVSVDRAGVDLAGSVLGCLVGPFLYVYYVLLFMSFVNLAVDNTTEVGL